MVIGLAVMPPHIHVQYIVDADTISIGNSHTPNEAQ